MPKSGSIHISSAFPTQRKDHEFPASVARLGWRYHHLGIPTALPRQAEKHLPAYDMFASGFDTSPYGIEWMRFEESSPLPEIIRTLPQIAFVVDDLETALAGREILFPVSAPSGGVRTAMVLDDGTPVELMEFEGPGSSRAS
jgi:hypothetical protein